jgi:hypothetical protein
MNIHTQTISNKTWNPVEGVFHFSFNFAFRTKHEYLEFRRHWKESYALLSTALRKQKGLIRVTMQSGEKAGEHQVKLLSMKAEARLQLLMLIAAKQEANRQYMAAKQMISKAQVRMERLAGSEKRYGQSALRSETPCLSNLAPGLQ